MFDFHEKRKIRSWLYSKVVIGVLFLLSGLISVSAYNRYEVSNEMRGKLEAKDKELQELQQRAQLLEAKVDYLDNERGIEEELRNRFDVAKEGEQVVILLNAKETAVEAAQVPESGVKSQQVGDEPKQSFFEFLKFW